MNLLGRFGVPDLRAKKRLELAKKSGHLTYMYIWGYIYIYVYIYMYVYIYICGDTHINIYIYREMKI